MEISKLVKNYREVTARFTNLSDAECANESLVERICDEMMDLQDKLVETLVKITNGRILHETAVKMICREEEKTLNLLIKYERALNY